MEIRASRTPTPACCGAQVAPVPDSGLRIAFATSDMRHVDEHFGTMTRLAIYRVDAGFACLERVVAFLLTPRDGREEKLHSRLAALDGCIALHCQAVGESAARQLMGRGVLPICPEETARIVDLVAAIQQRLAAGEPLWSTGPARRMGRSTPEQLRGMLDEAWEE
ncbi:MAG: nitrogen fixation protein NifX [Magnetococcales bacterium]|nr:nitrogen fixation protein NifX [Magnetococcales bacterium]